MKPAIAQAELFASMPAEPEKFTRRGDSIVPPTGEELAKAGMLRAVAHAERVTPKWGDRAYFVFAAYARGHAEFTTEDARRYAATLGFPAAPDPRAWGGVTRRALAEKIIEASGRYSKAGTSAHAREIKVWRSLVVRP